MDVHQILSVLWVEKRKLDKVIASLEELQAIQSDSAAPQKRGRKSMGKEERRKLSARMKMFWAEQKKRTRP
jgi:hypothetical protein